MRYRKPATPDGEPAQVGHFNSMWQPQEDVLAVVRSQDGVWWRCRRRAPVKQFQNKIASTAVFHVFAGAAGGGAGVSGRWGGAGGGAEGGGRAGMNFRWDNRHKIAWQNQCLTNGGKNQQRWTISNATFLLHPFRLLLLLRLPSIFVSL